MYYPSIDLARTIQADREREMAERNRLRRLLSVPNPPRNGAARRCSQFATFARTSAGSSTSARVAQLQHSARDFSRPVHAHPQYHASHPDQARAA